MHLRMKSIHSLGRSVLKGTMPMPRAAASAKIAETMQPLKFRGKLTFPAVLRSLFIDVSNSESRLTMSYHPRAKPARTSDKSASSSSSQVSLHSDNFVQKEAQKKDKQTEKDGEDQCNKFQQQSYLDNFFTFSMTQKMIDHIQFINDE